MQNLSLGFFLPRLYCIRSMIPNFKGRKQELLSWKK